MITIQTLATGSKGNCYHITDGHTPLLLECGIRYKQIQRKLNFETSDIAACLITHEHKDHCAGLNDVLKAGIDCYMSSGTKRAIGLTHHRLHSVENKNPFKIGTWTILPFDVQHDVSEPFGFLLASGTEDKLLFITDSFYCKYTFKGISHLMLECNYCTDVLNQNVAIGRIDKTLKKRVMRSHFGLEHVIEFLKANDLSKLQEIWLLHLSDSNSDEQLIRKEVAKVSGKLIHIP